MDEKNTDNANLIDNRMIDRLHGHAQLILSVSVTIVLDFYSEPKSS